MPGRLRARATIGLRLGLTCVLAGAAAGIAALISSEPAAAAGALPEIRSSEAQPVPSCVTPERLMQHVRERNDRFDPRFRDIARYYQLHGEALGVRWDYAFFQTLLETNYLSFRRANGEPGDVKPRQNNFAGLGATGGGVPGDSFPDVNTGVLAQMQHLLAYSGQRITHPVAARTREKQDDIIAQSLALRRPVRFSDLTRRWAADRTYHQSIEQIAEHYRQTFCVRAPDREPRIAASAPGDRAADMGKSCEVREASYGGSLALLIRSVAGSAINYTILQVEPGRERAQADAFIAMHARGGETIARFPSQQAALARAFALCPGPS